MRETVEMKTYKQHYQKAKTTEASLYDHTFVMNPFEIDQNNMIVGVFSRGCF